MKGIYANLIPEKRLVCGVLLQALLDHAYNLKHYNLKKASIMEPARWILSKDNGPFTFNWCCEILEHNPEKLLHRMWMPSFYIEARKIIQLEMIKERPSRAKRIIGYE